MKVNSNVKPILFLGEDSERLEMCRSTMGEPFKDGVQFSIEDGECYFSAFLDVRELIRMRDFLNDYLIGK